MQLYLLLAPSDPEGNAIMVSLGISAGLLAGAEVAVILSFVFGGAFGSFPPWLTSVQILVAVVCFHNRLSTTFLPYILEATTNLSSTTLDEKAVQIVAAELSPASDGGPHALVARAAHGYIAVFLSTSQLPYAFFHRFEPRALFIALLSWRALAIFWRLLHLIATDGFPKTDFAKSHDITAAAVAKTLGALRVAYWAFAALLLADNLGFKISSLLASAGIGGLAVALAAQEVLQDLLAAATLMVDKTLGDGGFVTVSGGDGVSGTVVTRGWKSTRIRTPSGTVMAVANKDICNSRVTTYPATPDRREVIEIQLNSHTSFAELEALPGWLETMVGGVEKAEYQTCYLKRVATDAMIFELRVGFPATGLSEYRVALHAVNLGIVRLVGEKGLWFAMPRKVIMSDSPTHSAISK